MRRINVQMQKIHKDAQLPNIATAYSAGADLYAVLEESVTLYPHCRITIPLGFKMALPIGFEAQVRSRSGLTKNHGVVVANSPGTIDADFRSEVLVLLHNIGAVPYEIKSGDRIAQMVIKEVPQVVYEWVDELPPSYSDRGEGGFGSTGR